MAQSIEQPEIHPAAQPRSHDRGITIARYFTRPGVDPMAEVEWDARSAVIAGEDGRVVFEQRDVEVPRGWSQTADQRRRLEVFPRAARQSAARDQRAPAYRAGGRYDHRMGRAAALFCRRRRARDLQGRTDPSAASTRRPRSTARSISTSESSPSRNARPASSSRSTTTWTRS